MAKQNEDVPGIVIEGQSLEGKDRRVILKPVFDGSEAEHRVQIEVIGYGGREMGMCRVEFIDLIDACEQIPELKRAIYNAVRFNWRP